MVISMMKPKWNLQLCPKCLSPHDPSHKDDKYSAHGDWHGEAEVDPFSVMPKMFLQWTPHDPRM
jgi:hypothetical protein